MIEPVSVDRTLVLVPNDQHDVAISEPGSKPDAFVAGIEGKLRQIVDLAPFVQATWSLIADEVATATRAWSDALRGANLPEVPPTDPRARALWLRQNRNTGPTQQRRAPRSIAPGRSR